MEIKDDHRMGVAREANRKHYFVPANKMCKGRLAT
jgi:hypothetical protein